MSGSQSQSSGAPLEATQSGTGADPSMEDILASIRRILSEEDGPPDQVDATKMPEPSVPEPEHQPDVLLLDSSMLVEDTPRPDAVKAAPQEPVPPAMSEITAREAIAPSAFTEKEPMSPHAGPPEAAGPAMVVPFIGENDPTEQVEAVAALALPPVLTMEPSAAIVPPESGIEPAPTIGATSPLPSPAMTSSQSETSPMSASTSSSAAASSGAFSSDDLASPEAASAAAGSVTNLVRALTSDRGAQVHSGGPTITDLVREELRPMLKSWIDSNLPPLVERLVRAEIDRVISRASV